MSNTPHDIYEDFPGDAEKIQALKVQNAHFERIFDEYHEVNRAVHRAETTVEPVEQLTEVEMRKKRAALKDEIARMLADA
ncbi:YdcH family protein [Phaeovulum sp.]|uniref:YdcH family protein n=1 Tax=Phaeovulum sp. TaxID=2934796 RepID=UPI0039E5A93B